MNTITPQECLNRWEDDYNRVYSDPACSDEERARLSYDVDQLYNEMYDLLIYSNVSQVYFENNLQELLS